MREPDDQLGEFGHDSGDRRPGQVAADEAGDAALPQRTSGEEPTRLGHRGRRVINSELLARVLRGLRTYD